MTGEGKMDYRLKFITSALFFLFLLNATYSQNFQNSVLIDMPGNNRDIDVATQTWGNTSLKSYIVWINEHDSVYSVMLKQMSPVIAEPVVVSSGKDIKANPRVTENYSWKGIKIAWQVFKNNRWEICTLDYIENNFNDSVNVIARTRNYPQISLAPNKLAWIDDGKLFVQMFGDVQTAPVILDSPNCSTPKADRWNYTNQGAILYIKKDSTGTRFKTSTYFNSKWTNYYQTNDTSCENPSVSLTGFAYIYQVKRNSVWEIAYEYGHSSLLYTGNKKCNFQNPEIFYYAALDRNRGITNYSPYFICYDSDSLAGNKEIFMKTYDFFTLDENIINISNSAGDDEKPKPVCFYNQGNLYIALVWEHTENGKTDIHMAKDNYWPIMVDVKEKAITLPTIYLGQNYPNPFNPSTTIGYSIPKESNVSLIIYNTLGQKVRELVNEVKPQGNYNIVFDGSGLSSGLYFYTLNSGGFNQTKKLILIK